MKNIDTFLHAPFANCKAFVCRRLIVSSYQLQMIQGIKIFELYCVLSFSLLLISSSNLDIMRDVNFMEDFSALKL